MKKLTFIESFMKSKDRNIILFFIILWIIILWMKIVLADNDQEIVNKITIKYNNIRKEYYQKDTININNINREIASLSTRKNILTKCVDYNYAHYNTVVEPIKCNDILETQLDIVEKWKVNKDGQSQAFIPLIANKTEERMNELLLSYWRGEDVLEKRWQRVGEKYKLKTPILICIAKADSSLWQALKTKNNFGNVWNNDRWDKVHFDSPIQGIEAIAQTLNNKYLNEYTEVKDLSRYGNKEWKIYASSEDNWHNNVINCLSSLYGKEIDDSFSFRN